MNKDEELAKLFKVIRWAIIVLIAMMVIMPILSMMFAPKMQEQQLKMINEYVNESELQTNYNRQDLSDVEENLNEY